MYQIYIWLKNRILPRTTPHQYKYGDIVYYEGNKWVVTRTEQWNGSYEQSLELSIINGRITVNTNNYDKCLKPIQRVYF